MTLEGIKNRKKLFKMYDAAMDKQCEELNRFKEESYTIIKENRETIKIYAFAFYLACSLRDNIELCKKYEEEVKNSLLDTRFETNEKLLDKFEERVNVLERYIKNISPTLDVSINNNVNVEIDASNEEKEKLIADKQYLLNLSNDLAKNGNKILNIVCFYMRYVVRQLTDIKNVRADMDDIKYRLLFEHEFKEYKSTDDWAELKDFFIDDNYKKNNNEELSKEDLYILQENEKKEIARVNGMGNIKPYIENYSKLGKKIVEKEFEADTNSPVLELFLHMGYYELTKNWLEQMDEINPYEEDIEDEDNGDYSYCEDLNENKCKKMMPNILKLYNGKNAKDWVCFYHVLVFYQNIIFDDFYAFNRWLTSITGEEKITYSNARKINMSYWAKNAKIKWTLDAAIKETDTKRQENLFKEYMRLCQSIYDIIREAKK